MTMHERDILDASRDRSRLMSREARQMLDRAREQRDLAQQMHDRAVASRARYLKVVCAFLGEPTLPTRTDVE